MVSEAELAFIVSVILKGDPPYSVCIKDMFDTECTHAYWCDDGPTVERNPYDENHFVIKTPCLNWRLECNGREVTGPGTVCVITVNSPDGNYDLWLSLRSDPGLDIRVRK